jgi:hypothetical protein
MRLRKEDVVGLRPTVLFLDRFRRSFLHGSLDRVVEVIETNILYASLCKVLMDCLLVRTKRRARSGAILPDLKYSSTEECAKIRKVIWSPLKSGYSFPTDCCWMRVTRLPSEAASSKRSVAIPDLSSDVSPRRTATISPTCSSVRGTMVYKSHCNIHSISSISSGCWVQI